MTPLFTLIMISQLFSLTMTRFNFCFNFLMEGVINRDEAVILGIVIRHILNKPYLRSLRVRYVEI